MARRQFFITTGDSHTLARKYDIFGQVTEGIPALAQLHKGDTIIWIAIVSRHPSPELSVEAAVR